MQRSRLVLAGVAYVFGVSIGVLVTLHLSKKELEEQANAYVSYYTDILNNKGVVVPDSVDSVEEVRTPTAIVDYTKYSTIVESYSKPALISESEEDDEGPPEPDERVPPEELDEKIRIGKPEPIEMIQYMEDCMFYDKLSLDYYATEDILADHRDEAIPDQSVVMGDHFDLLEKMRFAPEKERPSVIYMRDHVNAVDYEIVRNDREYYGG